MSVFMYTYVYIYVCVSTNYPHLYDGICTDFIKI